MNEFNTTTPSSLSGEDRTMAILAHLSGPITAWLGGACFIGPLIFYFLTRDKSPELRAHVLEALNFSISNTIIIWLLGLSMVLFITISFALIGILLVGIGYYIYGILAAVDVTNNRLRRYPLTWRLVTS